MAFFEVACIDIVPSCSSEWVAAYSHVRQIYLTNQLVFLSWMNFSRWQSLISTTAQETPLTLLHIYRGFIVASCLWLSH